jgi:GST-like protein
MGKEKQRIMIEVYSWATPNGHKVHIMLEECGLPYRATAVDIGAGDQFKPEFLAISPNNKIPAIVDPDGPDGRPMSPQIQVALNWFEELKQRVPIK